MAMGSQRLAKFTATSYMAQAKLRRRRSSQKKKGRCGFAAAPGRGGQPRLPLKDLQDTVDNLPSQREFDDCVFLLYACAEWMSNIVFMTQADDFSSLEYELRQVEARIRADFRERDLAWLEFARKAMLLIARMFVETSPLREHQKPAGTWVAGEALPIPGLEPRAIDAREFRTYAPEKFELIGGYLFDTAEHPESRRRLLALLLVNVGLLEVVSLAPEESWLKALQRVYTS